jgi:hypothetical protein
MKTEHDQSSASVLTPRTGDGQCTNITRRNTVITRGNTGTTRIYTFLTHFLTRFYSRPKPLAKDGFINGFGSIRASGIVGIYTFPFRIFISNVLSLPLRFIVTASPANASPMLERVLEQGLSRSQDSQFHA